MDTTLTKSKKETDVFYVYGKYNICITGSGTATIERLWGKDWVPVTDQDGELLSFQGDGVIFNGYIESPARMAHRITAETTKQVNVCGVSGR